MKDNKRWIYLAVGTVVLLFGGLLYGWSLFQGFLSAEFPMWSLTELSITFTISMICFCTGGIISGNMLKKISARVIIFIAGIMVAVGFIGVSLLNVNNPGASRIQLYICYGVMCGGAAGISFNAVIATVSKWFPDRSGFAVGAMMMGFGCGALVLGSVVSKMTESIGIFASFRVLGILGGVFFLAAAFIIKAPDADAVGAANSEEIHESELDLPTSKMLRTGTFWIFMLWSWLMVVAGIMIIGSAATIAVAAGFPAIIGMLTSFCNGLGRMLSGVLFDRFGRKWTMKYVMTLLIIASILLIAGTVCGLGIVIIIGQLVAGLSYGSNPPVSSSFVREMYGEKYYPSNFSIVNCVSIPASLVGPPVSSLLVGLLGGSYIGTFAMMLCCGIAGIGVYRILNIKST